MPFRYECVIYINFGFELGEAIKVNYAGNTDPDQVTITPNGTFRLWNPKPELSVPSRTAKTILEWAFKNIDEVQSTFKERYSHTPDCVQRIFSTIPGHPKGKIIIHGHGLAGMPGLGFRDYLFQESIIPANLIAVIIASYLDSICKPRFTKEKPLGILLVACHAAEYGLDQAKSLTLVIAEEFSKSCNSSFIRVSGFVSFTTISGFPPVGKITPVIHRQVFPRLPPQSVDRAPLSHGDELIEMFPFDQNTRRQKLYKRVVSVQPGPMPKDYYEVAIPTIAVTRIVVDGGLKTIRPAPEPIVEVFIGQFMGVCYEVIKTQLGGQPNIDPVHSLHNKDVESSFIFMLQELTNANNIEELKKIILEFYRACRDNLNPTTIAMRSKDSYFQSLIPIGADHTRRLLNVILKALGILSKPLTEVRLFLTKPERWGKF